MDAIEDQLEHGARIDGRDDGARRTVPDPAHRVEGVGQDARAAVERGPSLVVTRIGVADGDRDARVLQHRLAGGGSLALGRQRDHAQRAVTGRQQAVDVRRFRVAKGRGVVRAAAGVGEIRSLEVRAEDERIRARRRGDPREAALEAIDGRGHEAEQLPGRAVRTVEREGGLEIGLVVE